MPKLTFDLGEGRSMFAVDFAPQYPAFGFLAPRMPDGTLLMRQINLWCLALVWFLPASCEDGAPATANPWGK